MRVTTMGFLGAIWICLGFNVQAQNQVPVQISLPNIKAKPGETIDIPLAIGDVTGLNITATDLLITYDARIVTAVRPILTGTFTERWSEAFRVGFLAGSRDTTGLIDIALATSNRIPAGAGTFVKVRFTVSDSAKDGQVSPLVLSEAILNNRNPQTTTQNGSLTVQVGGTIQGDFNGDCAVNFQDFLLFVQHFPSAQGDPRYDPIFDLNADGQIGFPDFIIFVRLFGNTCS